MNVIKVSHSFTHNNDKMYVNLRKIYVNLCINPDELKFPSHNTGWKFVKKLSMHHILLKHDDKFRTLRTYFTKINQACSYKPFESLAFISDENSDPLCDPFNDSLINNCGENIKETHYASFYNLLNIIFYNKC